MRRFFYWFVPLGFAVIGAALFGWGFVSAVTGNTGSTVPIAEPPREEKVALSSAQIRAVVLGDSVGRGTGDPSGLGIGGAVDAELAKRRIPHKTHVNLAVNGSRTTDLLALLESTNVRRILRESNVVIISIGGNDLFFDEAMGRASAQPPDPEAAMEAVLGRIETIAGEVRGASPEARIYLIGLYNPFHRTPGGSALTSMVNRWNAKVIDRLRSDPNLIVVPTVDLFTHRDLLSLDRFHPGGEAYQLIGRRIVDSI